MPYCHVPCSRSVGYRFGRHLAVAVPLMVSQCEGAAEGDDELRELCLQEGGRGRLDAGLGVVCPLWVPLGRL